MPAIIVDSGFSNMECLVARDISEREFELGGDDSQERIDDDGESGSQNEQGDEDGTLLVFRGLSL